MTGKKEKLISHCIHGIEDAEKATLPFAMALGAQATDLDVTVVLQAGAVLLAVKGEREGLLPDVEAVSVSRLNGEFSSAPNVVCY